MRKGLIWKCWGSINRGVPMSCKVCNMYIHVHVASAYYVVIFCNNFCENWMEIGYFCYLLKLTFKMLVTWGYNIKWNKLTGWLTWVTQSNWCKRRCHHHFLNMYPCISFLLPPVFCYNYLQDKLSLCSACIRFLTSLLWRSWLS